MHEILLSLQECPSGDRVNRRRGKNLHAAGGNNNDISNVELRRKEDIHINLVCQSDVG